jgi:hypothetical protein
MHNFHKNISNQSPDRFINKAQHIHDIPAQRLGIGYSSRTPSNLSSRPITHL